MIVSSKEIMSESGQPCSLYSALMISELLCRDRPEKNSFAAGFETQLGVLLEVEIEVDGDTEIRRIR